ncbi:MAG TPA: signal peptidase I [Terracidiphilus sp.]|jgi:signal peptidase I|nr:signal peptidase I [Terracidiphilus sp.]
MNRKNTAIATEPDTTEAASKPVEETLYEAVASICSILVIGLFILTFLGQNYVIPSGSMENTLLIGDHLLVDRITFAPPAKSMPLVHYREPRNGDILVFIKPVPDEVNGEYQYLDLVKRCVGIPGDHIHLHDGVVYVNGVVQPVRPTAIPGGPAIDPVFLDEFPATAPTAQPGATPESWAIDFPNHIENGDLVVPPGKYFMMGDNRHNSLDSRYWGFVPRENIIGRPLFNYWSFETPEDQYNQTSIGSRIAWMGHVALHFFTETRWKRTLKMIH